MTNAQIILQESVALMEQGILAGTGELVKVLTINEEGEEVEKELEMPEQIHTFAAWKKLGYKVKRGEKAIASFPVWKYSAKKVLDDNKKVVLDENGEEMVKTSMFLKTAFFFKMSQVEKEAK